MTRFFSLMTLLGFFVLSPWVASATSANFLRKELDKPGVQMVVVELYATCLLYTSPSPRDGLLSRMPSSA